MMRSVTLLLICSAIFLSAGEVPFNCKVGDRVEGHNIGWYAATVTEVGLGANQGDCYLKWDKFAGGQWINARNIRPLGDAAQSAAPTPAAQPPVAKYACGVFLNTRFTFTQYVSLKTGGNYEVSTGGSGHYQFEPASKRIRFDNGPLKDLFGRYEPENHQLFRLTLKDDAAKSTDTQNWRSQVCSPQQ